MSPTDLRREVLEILRRLDGLEPLRQLFWTKLSYPRINTPISRRRWPETSRAALAEDPVLFAAGGADEAFHVIYARLADERLLISPQRDVVNQLLRDHPYSLFIFSNRARDRWHFLNVKIVRNEESEENADPKLRRMFRRITVGPEERFGNRLRTATDRLSKLDLDAMPGDLSGLQPLTIQDAHDKAFDVESVQKSFFRDLKAQALAIDEDITGRTDPDREVDPQTLLLLNRILFLYFIQKKGWLAGRPDFLVRGFDPFRSQPKRTGYYPKFLQPLFEALATPESDRRSELRTFSGVPFLNGGLFELEGTLTEADLKVKNGTFARLFEDLLERYNFTITEDTPFDEEVAVDPEMLGRIFEELVNERHDSGRYYTPRAIVSFMCREALKPYLGGGDEVALFVDEHDASRIKDPEAVLKKLQEVKVCDPACGSGAYLVGMMQEIMALRHSLFVSRQIDPVSDYRRKLEIIQNNLYGVDIDAIAVHIARLRLWLSLCVEFKGDRPEPLPNLDFKIEQGDSLTAPEPTGAVGLYADRIEEYDRLKAEYARSNVYGDKTGLRKEIDNVRNELTEWTHAGQDVQGFDWHVEFAEVFARPEAPGFDIILANPPYVRQERIKDLKPILRARYHEVYTGTADLYCYFYARALDLIRQGGVLVFISSKKWLRARYGANLRGYIAETCRIRSITDFGDLPVFQSSLAYAMIFIAQKGEPDGSPLFTEVRSLDPPYPDVLALVRQNGARLPADAIKGSSWTLTDAATAERLRKMQKAGIPLKVYVKGEIYYGIKTGLNKAFVIDGAKRQELIAEDPRSAEIIQAVATGKDIRRWCIHPRDRWLIFTRRGIRIDDYPAVKRHLAKWGRELEPRPLDWDEGNQGKWPGRKPGRYMWHEIQDDIAYYRAFAKPKIVFPDIAKEVRFSFDEEETLLINTAYFIPTNDLYLLGVLNSQAMADYYVEVSAQIRGGYVRFFEQYVENLPIPNPTQYERQSIVTFVQKCLDAGGEDCDAWEREIDERVAALYGLSSKPGRE